MSLEAGYLTPIYVRGRKRLRREELKPRRAKKPEKRAPSAASTAAGTLSKKRKRTQQQQMSRSKGKLSPLESLPAELIELIFIECLEFNLPRASPHVAKSLSREPLYRALILYALWNDPDPDDAVEDTPSARAVSRMLRPVNYVPLAVRDRRALQLAIFACRWCTLDRVRSCVRDLAVLWLNRWFCGRGKHADGLNISTSDLDTIEEGLEKHVLHLEHIVNSTDDSGSRSVKCSFNSDNFAEVMAVWFHERPYVIRPILVVAIPDALIVGNPWSTERVAFLALLRGWLGDAMYRKEVEGGTPVPYVEGKLHDGIHAAIVEQNPLALRWLLEIDRAYQPIYRPGSQYTDSYKVPLRHYLTAVRQSDDPTALRLLASQSPVSFPFDDPEVTSWAMRLQELGDPFGGQVLDIMANPHVASSHRQFLAMIGEPFDSHPDESDPSFLSGWRPLPDLMMKMKPPVSEPRIWFLEEQERPS